jgi:hypothetical protein
MRAEGTGEKALQNNRRKREKTAPKINTMENALFSFF